MTSDAFPLGTQVLLDKGIAAEVVNIIDGKTYEVKTVADGKKLDKKFKKSDLKPRRKLNIELALKRVAALDADLRKSQNKIKELKEKEKALEAMERVGGEVNKEAGSSGPMFSKEQASKQLEDEAIKEKKLEGEKRGDRSDREVGGGEGAQYRADDRRAGRFGAVHQGGGGEHRLQGGVRKARGGHQDALQGYERAEGEDPG